MTKLSIKKTLLILAATGAFSFLNAQKIAHLSFDSLVATFLKKINKKIYNNYKNELKTLKLKQAKIIKENRPN